MPRWTMNEAGPLPDRHRMMYLPRRSTFWMMRPFKPSTSSAADGFLTVLAQVMFAPAIVEPVSPARTKFRRVFSTSGSSGISGSFERLMASLSNHCIGTTTLYAVICSTTNGKRQTQKVCKS